MTKKLNVQWVSDLIGDTYKKWKRGDIVLLDAQTGTGKTNFIKNKIIGNLDESEKLLYVCNRTNLKRQFKIRLLDRYNLPIPMNVDETSINWEKLDQITKIQNVVITSYQAIQETNLSEIYGEGKCSLDYYDWIILDEVHYIMSDGSFNNKCRLAYKKLIQEYQHNSIKVFISATMDELIKPIESNINKLIGKKPMIHSYSTDVDYSYLDIHYFKGLVSIINLIQNDGTSDKWLIFVSSKDNAKYISDALGEELCTIIVSGTKNDELSQIINESKFSKKVLICTKVLDNGINIDDEMLKHIVIMAWDKTTFIQELGRKRINIEAAQQVKLYIPTRQKKSFSSKLKSTIDKINEVILLEQDENRFNKRYDNNLDEIGRLNHVVYRDRQSGKWRINIIGYFRLKKDAEFFQIMKDRFDYEGEFAFIYEQLEWIGQRHTFSEAKLIEDVAYQKDIQSLEEYLSQNVGKIMLREKDRQELVEKIGLVDVNHSSTKKGKVKLLKNIKTLNSYLDEIESDYIIKESSTSKIINGKKRSFNHAWKILRLTDSFKSIS